VARLGGDEFVVLLDELGEDFEGSVTQADGVAQRIGAALAEPYILAYKPGNKEETQAKHRCTSSIGIALFHGSNAKLEDTLKSADTAMYQAKEAGRNTFRFFAPGSASSRAKTCPKKSPEQPGSFNTGTNNTL